MSRSSPLLLGIATGAVGVLAGCGSSGHVRSLTVDEASGRVGQVTIGESRAGVIAALGHPGDVRSGGPYAPLDESFVDIGGPESVTLPMATRTHEILRYRHLAILLADGRVHSVLVTGHARTRHGPSIGEALSAVRHAFLAAQCWDVAAGEDGDTYPSCEARVPAGRIAFGRDPIRSITLTARRNG